MAHLVRWLTYYIKMVDLSMAMSNSQMVRVFYGNIVGMFMGIQ